ncbi:uncharacterized protein PFL1_02359 [Pseudozyma flocculosa PF-1]|uniref:cAMP-dependent protein kinase n=1 Tax=Pseudozyma flocculosa TaxID=84751 RepID=A0A5C3F607_9BASI|nr:uncharacterized protein PFL1_02359 [Pseudozyma flocculosa PF-1]EPQ30243.1 hypothetical protein PFL1_02359 [Pseudozyma flocculosa PF-1]SPO39822.1 related to cAMP-dependent protein kinase catalytic subunit [Pseudozyma flocculosa]
MTKRYRGDADGTASEQARKARCTGSMVDSADGAGHASSSDSAAPHRQLPAVADSPALHQSQDDVDFPGFDAAIALGLDVDDPFICDPVASGSRPAALPRTMDERFVPGLQTFVGGLEMSRPLHERTAAAMPGPSSAHFDGVSIEPPPLHMSRRSVSSQRSSSPPRPSLDGTVRIVPNEGLAAPPTAPLVPGVSPGWHVESHGRQAMELHEGVRYRDDEGWTPLDAFPARTQQGRSAANGARLQRRKVRAPDAQLLESPYRPATDTMSISTTSQLSPPRKPSSNEIFSEASGSRPRPSLRGSFQKSSVSLPPISTIRLAPMEGDDLRELSPIDNLSTLQPPSSKAHEFRPRPVQLGANEGPTQAAPAPHVRFQNGVPTTSARSPLVSEPVAHGRKALRQPAADSLTANATTAYRLQDFEVLETLGTGTFGRVLLVRLKSKETTDPSAYFALKVLSKSEVVRLKQVEHTNSERAILHKVRHPFLVNLITTFQDSKNCYMLMDYVIGGEVFSYLRRAGRFSVDVTRFYISTIVLAIEYLHDRNIIYRDLKPENLLLDDQGYTKITDFGFAKEVEDRTWTLCGTPEYLAPEIIQSKGHGKAVDWWALGILLFEMLAGYPPFYDNQPFGVYEKILQGNIVFPAHIDEVSRDLIRSLLTADRTRRLGNLRGGAQDVKNHFWFHGVDWDQLAARNIRPPIVPFNTQAGDTSNFSKYERVRLSSLPGFAVDAAASSSSSSLDGPARQEEVDPHAHLFTAF